MKKGRIAELISPEDFIEKVKKLHNGKGYTDEEDWEEICEKGFNGEIVSLEAFMEIPTVRKDLSKILFDTENQTAVTGEFSLPVKGSLLGLRTLKNGLTFLGFAAGGDGNPPIFLIIYWNNGFRGYIPTDGNLVNLDFKCAFFSEADTEYGPYGPKWYMREEEYDGIDEEELAFVALVKQGLCKSKEDFLEKPLFIDWPALLEDILGRIEVKES